MSINNKINKQDKNPVKRKMGIEGGKSRCRLVAV